MKSLKKFFTVGLLTLTVAAVGMTSFATSAYKTPAEAAAGVTGRTVESVVAERLESGKTYGTIANDAGKLAEYKAANLEMKKDALAAQVEAGTLTQEKADSALKTFTKYQEACDGTGECMAQDCAKGVCDGTGKEKGNGLAKGHVNGMGHHKTNGNGHGSAGHGCR